MNIISQQRGKENLANLTENGLTVVNSLHVTSLLWGKYRMSPHVSQIADNSDIIRPRSLHSPRQRLIETLEE